MKGSDIGFDLWVARAEEFIRIEIRDEFAFAEEHDSVAEVERFIQIVGHEQDCLLQAGEQGAQHILHLGTGERIECAEGLVHQEHARLRSQSACQAHALALAAR